MSATVWNVVGAVTSTDITVLSSGSAPKMVLNSSKNMDNTGAGIFSVGENTMPTRKPQISFYFFHWIDIT